MNATMRLLATGLFATLLALPAAGSAAETVHLVLTLDGTVVKGDSTQSSLGRQDTIECTLFRTGLRTQGVSIPAVGGTITIRKRIDRATPYLLKGLTQGAAAEGTFRFYRPNPTGDGTTEQFYTVTGTGGVVTSVRQLVPDTMAPANSSSPPLEEITFQFRALSFAITNGEVTANWEGKL